MSLTRKLGWLLPAVLLGTLLHAQAPQPAAAPAVPTVTFTLDWPGEEPRHHSVVVEYSGRAVYRSLVFSPPALPTPSHPAQSGPGDPYEVKFTVSEPTRARLFALARELNYFQGDFDFRKHPIAFTGNKTLAYAGPGRQFQTTYNWSENSKLEELTEIFEGMANTLESGRRLVQLRRYDKLGLENELRGMEDMAKYKMLVEVHVIAPLLREIAADPAVLHIARERARRLLGLAGTESPTTSAPQ